jgi:hypothetical protein
VSRRDVRADTGLSLARKFVISGGTGLATFAVSALLDGTLNVPLPDQLLLTTLVGGITLLAQYLVDFEARLFSLEAQQTANLAEARTVIDQGFARISEATRVFDLLQNPALPESSLTALVQHAGGIHPTSAVLVRQLAAHEIERVSTLLRNLSGGTEVFYDGEDREWLLGLAQRAQKSIWATSLATVDAGGAGFEGGIWKNDLGGRYLALQREAVNRGVEIRRIFVFDRPDLQVDPEFITIRHLQTAAGVQIRVLDNSMVPEYLKTVISDFIVFDEEISYEIQPATQMDGRFKPAILTTRLILEAARVHRKAERFDELWQVAQEID